MSGGGADGAAGGRPPLLVCEDDDRYRSLLVRLLEAQERFEVRDCSSGERACELARQAPPQLPC